MLLDIWRLCSCCNTDIYQTLALLTIQLPTKILQIVQMSPSYRSLHKHMSPRATMWPERLCSAPMHVSRSSITIAGHMTYVISESCIWCTIIQRASMKSWSFALKVIWRVNQVWTKKFSPVQNFWKQKKSREYLILVDWRGFKAALIVLHDLQYT